MNLLHGELVYISMCVVVVGRMIQWQTSTDRWCGQTVCGSDLVYGSSLLRNARAWGIILVWATYTKCLMLTFHVMDWASVFSPIAVPKRFVWEGVSRHLPRVHLSTVWNDVLQARHWAGAGAFVSRSSSPSLRLSSAAVLIATAVQGIKGYLISSHSPDEL